MRAELKIYKRGFLRRGSNYYSLALLPENPEETKILQRLFRDQVVWIAPSMVTDKDRKVVINIHWFGKK